MVLQIIKRLLFALLTIAIVTIIAAVLIRTVPGDPVTAILAHSASATPEAAEAMRAKLALDLPIWKQVLYYLANVVRVDLGTTIRGGEPVASLLLMRLPNTLALAAAGLGTALAIGIPLAFLAALNKGRIADVAITAISVLGVSIPGFWLGLVLIQVFALDLGWLPVASSGFKGVILPALTLGLCYSALIARMMRSALIDILSEDYIRTARAKGLREREILFVHALKPALLTTVTVSGLVFAYLLGGQVVVENVFSWNGIGRLAVEAMRERDYPLVQGFIIVFASTIVVTTASIDILYGLLDPRMRRPL